MPDRLADSARRSLFPTGERRIDWIRAASDISEPAHEEMFPPGALRYFYDCASTSKNRRTRNDPTGA